MGNHESVPVNAASPPVIPLSLRLMTASWRAGHRLRHPQTHVPGALTLKHKELPSTCCRPEFLLPLLAAVWTR